MVAVVTLEADSAEGWEIDPLTLAVQPLASVTV